MADYDAVIFDLFGTLIDNVSMDSYLPAIDRMARSLDVPPEQFRQVWRDDSLSRRPATGQLANPEQAVHAGRALLGAKPSARAVHRAAEIRRQMYAEWVVPRPGVIETLQTIRQAGLKLALMSGCTGEVPALWPETEMAQFFSAALFSCVLGLEKPDPAFYAAALEALDVPASRCLYVGDGASDELDGAVEAGMQAVLLVAAHERSTVMARQQCRDWMGKTITDIRQVPRLLGLDQPADRDPFDVGAELFEQTLSDSAAEALAETPAGAEEGEEESADDGEVPELSLADEQMPQAPSTADAVPPPRSPKAKAGKPPRPKRKGQSPFRAVCFGLQGTLVANPDPDGLKTVLRRVAGRVGADPKRFCKLWQGRDVRSERIVGTLASPSAAIRHICRQLRVDPADDQIRHAVTCLYEYAWLSLLPAPDALGVLHRLRRLGWKTACLARCSVEVPQYWPRTVFAELFDTTVFSCQQRMDLDQPEMFQLAAAMLGTRAERCCFVSDKPEQLAVANLAGMTAVLYNPSAGPADWPGRQLTNLDKIMRVLR